VAFPVLTEWLVNNIFVLIPVKKIHSYERGVKFRNGKDIRELRHGIYFYIPFYESIEKVDVQQQTHNLLSQSMTSKDMLPITFSCNLKYRVKNARKMFTVVHNFDESLENEVMMVIADEASKMTFSDLVKKRNIVEKRAMKRIGVQAVKWGAVVDGFAFTDLVNARQYRFFGDTPKF
jgi:regulator of protease activity HflC (stomatin/prohibitin superfamily)